MEKINQLWPSRYIELNKTYRSSPEIIEYANQILSLHHICAIQKKQDKPVIIRHDDTFLLDDIAYLLKRHKRVAIITHDEVDAKMIYEQIKNLYSVSLLLDETTIFNNDFIIIPAYLAKELGFESVLLYQNKNHYYTDSKKIYIMLG